MRQRWRSCGNSLKTTPSAPGFVRRFLGGGSPRITAPLADMAANGMAEAARVRLREAIGWQRKALAINPANPTYRQFLANHFINHLIKAA